MQSFLIRQLIAQLMKITDLPGELWSPLITNYLSATDWPNVSRVCRHIYYSNTWDFSPFKLRWLCFRKYLINRTPLNACLAFQLHLHAIHPQMTRAFSAAFYEHYNHLQISNTLLQAVFGNFGSNLTIIINLFRYGCMVRSRPAINALLYAYRRFESSAELIPGWLMEIMQQCKIKIPSRPSKELAREMAAFLSYNYFELSRPQKESLTNITSLSSTQTTGRDEVEGSVMLAICFGWFNLARLLIAEYGVNVQRLDQQYQVLAMSTRSFHKNECRMWAEYGCNIHAHNDLAVETARGLNGRQLIAFFQQF
jgi:hypothetical protein